MVVTLILIIIFLAFIMEVIDTSLGMMYGTLLSPILIAFGLDPLLVVPAILISQAIGGMSGTLSHHWFKNADFNGLTKDMRIVLAMVIPGLIVVFLGVFIAVNIPSLWVKTYIGFLVIIMSILCLTQINYKFAWWKHYAIGVIAAFNKALSGGGFGPVTSTGGIIGGLKSKVSIATTTFAEVYVCLGAFVIYILFVGIRDVFFISALSFGSFIGGFTGPYLSSKTSHEHLRNYIGIIGILSGVWLLYNIVI